MAKYTYLALLLFFLFSHHTLPAQGESQNLKKYWDYRARFLEGFIDIGDKPGQSIPVAGRVPHGDCSKDYFLDYNGCPKSKGLGILYWGDSAIELGTYITTLALEIKNLKDAGLDYNTTARELYYALKAVDRIDRRAEIFYGKEEKLDGFFIRDDVPGDFAYKDGKQRMNIEGQEYNCVISDGACIYDELTNGGAAMSIDQVTNLMLGFTTVATLIPDIKHNNESLLEITQGAVHRITSFLADNRWKIRDPDGIVPPSNWGGNAIALSYVVAKAADRITQGKYRKTYQTRLSKRRGKMIFKTFNWAHGIQANHNLWMAYAGVNMANLWDLERISKRAIKIHQYNFPFLYYIMNGGDIQELEKHIPRSKIQEILDSAPESGPCFNTPGCEAPDGWKCSDRWLHFNHRDGNPYGIEREFNGMDYMLMYNLYYMVYKDKIGKYNPIR